VLFGLPGKSAWDSRGEGLPKLFCKGIGPLNFVAPQTAIQELRQIMRILITGGAGFIGSTIAESYVSAGHEVAVIDNLSTGRRENVPPGVLFYLGDITAAAEVERVFADFRPEVVSHHAAQMDIRRSLREPLFDASVNILGSLSVLEMCVKFGVKKFIFASSGGAIYGEPQILPATEATPEMPISHYGVTKLTVERYLHAYHRLYGLQFCALRYANVYGPRQNPHGEAGVVAIFTGQLLRGETATIYGDGSKTRDYVFVGDVVAANLLALERSDCGVFNVGRGVQTSDFEMFTAIRDAVGCTDEPVFAPHRNGEVQHIALDAKAAAGGLGWKPKVGLAEGIRRTVAHIRNVADSNMTVGSQMRNAAQQPAPTGEIRESL
jgi:UDP-glucose 4-epimerase